MDAKRARAMAAKIDALLGEGIDPAAISTLLRCRFADVQMGQRRLATKRTAVERAEAARLEEATAPEAVDKMAADILIAFAKAKNAGSRRAGGHRSESGISREREPAIREIVPWHPPEPRHFGYKLPIANW